ncbi:MULTISPECIES: hypothetical protein [unclassified Streptomyces]|uniref:hypothetical protein n=1 Tax=unclassified Streptomyces TaxID=2593676 RepID=UPI0022514048|nr:MULTISPECIES: hypothetical protein [unclassified Streptomyces]MCX4404761.1 hypothetical protein [Streptomyces sp. NBC_01764]MCX5190692.1 hypothetical protein [Streptomyces sp. NBC_00268]
MRDEVSKGGLEVVNVKREVDPAGIAVAVLDLHLIRSGVLAEPEVEVCTRAQNRGLPVLASVATPG